MIMIWNLKCRMRYRSCDFLSKKQRQLLKEIIKIIWPKILLNRHKLRHKIIKIQKIIAKSKTWSKRKWFNQKLRSWMNSQIMKNWCSDRVKDIYAMEKINVFHKRKLSLLLSAVLKTVNQKSHWINQEIHLMIQIAKIK